MPSVDDWIGCPLRVIQTLFDENRDDPTHTTKTREFFSEKISSNVELSWIPSLNSIPLHEVTNGSLVRFRCMIQDMQDPEFYLGVYEVVDRTTGATCQRTGKFKDVVRCSKDEDIIVDSPRNVTLDRQTFYCIPIPGESCWVKDAFAAQGHKKKSVPCGSLNGTGLKRPLVEDAMETDTDTSAEASSKRQRISANTTSSSTVQNMNFPLPDETGPACLVKVYGDDGERFKVNDVVEFIGVLSVDSAVVRNAEPNQEVSSLMGEISDEELRGYSPPPSLVPRLHAILSRRLPHNNPHLSQERPFDSSSLDVTQFEQDLPQARNELLDIFGKLLGEDRLAAEYLLCHLISRVYGRHDVVAVGKFSLNLSNLTSSLSAQIYQLCSSLVTKSFLFPLALSNMNTFSLCPRKDYTANRLTTGILQLADGTLLCLDEIALQAGQLNDRGVRNMAALEKLLCWQRVEYDFNYHKQEFNTDINVLIFSEGKSMLKADCHVPLNPQQSNSASTLDEIQERLTPEVLTRIRTYLTLVQHFDYTLSEDVQKRIEQDFVTIRQDDPRNLSVEDFHSLLILTRLLSLSMGHKELQLSMWEKAKLLEQERKRRLETAIVASRS